MKKILLYLDDLLYIIGSAVVTYGVYQIYVPAGIIVGGLFMIFYAVLIAANRKG